MSSNKQFEKKKPNTGKFQRKEKIIRIGKRIIGGLVTVGSVVGPIILKRKNKG